MNSVRTTTRHTVFRSHICAYALCSSENHDGMEDAGAQIIPISIEISVAYLCKECFYHLPVREVISTTKSCLKAEKDLFEKFFSQSKRGIISSDPGMYLEASIRFLRGELTEPPFLSPAFLHSNMIVGNPKIIHREHLALILFT